MNAATEFKQLPVDLAELCIALEAEAGDDLRWFLDLSTGEVILVGREYEAQDYGGLTVDEIRSTPSRFLTVPSSGEGMLADMTAFVKGLDDVRLRESLELALSAPRPERRFRAVLGWLPEEQEKWQSFRRGRIESRARAWLESIKIVATPVPHAAHDDE